MWARGAWRVALPTAFAPIGMWLISARPPDDVCGSASLLLDTSLPRARRAARVQSGGTQVGHEMMARDGQQGR